MEVKTIKACAEINYFTPDNLPAEALENQYFKERLNGYLQRYAAVKIPEALISFGAVALFELKRDTTCAGEVLYYIDYSSIYICLLSPAGNMCQLIFRNGKYEFFPVYSIINRLHRTTNYDLRKPFLEKVKEPNKIGVFNPRKIADWLNYCDQYISACREAENSLLSNKQRNEQKIADTIASLPGCKVQKSTDRAYIETKFFCIDFELCDNGNYLSQKIRFTGSLEDIIKHQL